MQLIITQATMATFLVETHRLSCAGVFIFEIHNLLQSQTRPSFRRVARKLEEMTHVSEESNTRLMSPTTEPWIEVTLGPMVFTLV